MRYGSPVRESVDADVSYQKGGSPLRSSGRQSSPQGINLRNLIQEKEQEIMQANDQRVRILENRIIELEEAERRAEMTKSVAEQRLDGLTRDFNTNLKLLEERNVEAERLEGVIQGLRAAAENREQAMVSTRRRLHELEQEELAWRKVERDLKWKIEQLESRVKDNESLKDQDMQRREQELLYQQRVAEQDLERMRDELMLERTELCRDYERKLQNSLMGEEELKATVSRQHMELAEAARKVHRLEQSQRTMDAQAAELQAVVKQFESAVTALQDLEAKYSQLLTEHSHMKLQKQNKIQELEKQVEELKLSDARRVAHFEQKVHELAKAQENVEQAYQLSQQESASMEERLQHGMRTAIAENKKLKAKLKDAEARITRHLQEVEHFKVMAEQEKGHAAQNRMSGEALRRELEGKVALIATLQSQLNEMQRRETSLMDEVRLAKEKATSSQEEAERAQGETSHAMARAASAEEQARTLMRRVKEEQKRNAAFAADFLAPEQDSIRLERTSPAKDSGFGSSIAEMLSALSMDREKLAEQISATDRKAPARSTERYDNLSAAQSLQASLNSVPAPPATDVTNLAYSRDNSPLAHARRPEAPPIQIAMNNVAAFNSSVPTSPRGPGQPDRPPPSADPGRPEASVSPTRPVGIPRASERLEARRKQWDLEEERLREQRKARQREMDRMISEEREARRRAKQEEAVRLAERRRLEAESRRHEEAVGMLRIKASQLSEENNRLRRHMASLASLGDARSSSPPPEPLDYPRLPAGSLPSSPPRARANWPHRTLEPGIPQNPWRITRSNEAMNGSTSFEASDRSNVNVHVNVYDTSADDIVNISSSSPIMDATRKSLAGGVKKSSMTFRLGSPDRGTAELATSTVSKSPRATQSTARERILAAKAELERVAAQEPKPQGRKGQRKTNSRQRQ